jgi:hypothetical protein
MKVKRAKIIRIQKIMPKTIQKQTGLYKLSRTELANLNAWLNLPKTRAVLPRFASARSNLKNGQTGHSVISKAYQGSALQDNRLDEA